MSCLSTFPIHSSPGNLGGLVGQLLDIFPLSLSCVLRQEEKEKRTVVSYLTGVVTALLVDGCGSPRLSLSSYCNVAFLTGNANEFVGGLCGGFPSAQSPKPEALHLASSPFLGGAGRVAPVQLSSEIRI